MTNSSEMLTSPRMTELMQALEAETPRRIMIFDMPPVLAADDVLAFAPQIDGLLLVVARRHDRVATHCAARRKCWRK